MAWKEGQLFKCINFNCGAELRLINRPNDKRMPEWLPICFCASPMKRWPEAVLGNDQFEDV